MKKCVMAACLVMASGSVVSAQQTARVFLDTVGAGASQNRPATPLSYTNPVGTQLSRYYIYAAYGQANQKIATWRIDLAVRGPARISGWSIYNHTLPGNGNPRWGSVNQGVLSVDGKRVSGIEMLGAGAPAGASNAPAVTAVDTFHYRPPAGANDPFGTTLLGFVDVLHTGGEGSAAVRVELGTVATPGVYYTVGVPGTDTVSLGWNDAAIVANTSGGTTTFAEAVLVPPAVRPPTVVLSTLVTQDTSLVPGGLGGTERYSVFDRPHTSPDGSRLILTANTDAAASQDDVLMVGSLLPKPRVVVAVREGAATFFDGTVNWGILDEECGINDAGQYAFSADTSAALGTDEVVARWNGVGFDLMAREGSAAVGQLGGIGYGSTADGATILNGGDVCFRSSGLTAATTQQVLYRLSAPGAGSVLAQTDTTIPTGQLVPPAQGIDNLAAFSAMFEQLTGQFIYRGDLNGPGASDLFVAVGNAVRAQEGLALPGSSFGSNVLTMFGRHAIAPGGGRWVYRGANADGDEWVAIGPSGPTDAVLAATGRPYLPESTRAWTSGAFFHNVIGRADRVVVGGFTDAPDTTTDAVKVFRNRAELIRENDLVDLNADGLLTDDARISVFNNDDAFLTDDGRYYFTANLRDTAGVTLGQALLRMSTPDLLHDNGPIVTAQGVGANGSDIARDSDTPGSIGGGQNMAGTNRMTDDFTVPPNTQWTLRTLTLFAYRATTPAGDPPVSPFSGATLRIWDGVPGAVGSNIVFGDTATNRMVSSGFSGTYKIRVGDLDDGNTRPIMMVNLELPDVVLGEGTYWLDWGYTISGVGTAFQPPVGLNGLEGKPGGNGLWSNNGGVSYAQVSAGPNDFPFVLRGDGKLVEIDESEPNNTRPTATDAGMSLNGGPVVTGTATGADVDYFRIATPPVNGIWRHTLTLTCATPGHTVNLRGTQANLLTADPSIQGARVSGTDRIVEWYSLPGADPFMVVSVLGNASTTAPYFMTLTSVPVTPTVVAGGGLRGETILITAAGQGHTTDTEIQVYNGALAAIPNYNNDDRPPTIRPSYLRRPYAPGTYHLAMARFQLTTSEPNVASDEGFTSQLITLSPSTAVVSSVTTPANVSFRFGTSGESRAVAAATNEPADIEWFEFTVLASLACNAADIATAGSLDPTAGPDGFLTGEDFDLFVAAFFGELRNHADALVADLTDGAGVGGPDGFLTGSDFDRFLFLFFSGCP